MSITHMDHVAPPRESVHQWPEYWQMYATVTVEAERKNERTFTKHCSIFV